MTIDEAIQHCEEVMMENLEKTKDRNASDPIAINCFECADEHRQLAEWLKELKAYKDARAEINQAFNDDVRNDQNDYERGRKSGIFLCESIISVKLDESSSENPNKWIPVSERVPEITIHSECGLSWSDYVLVYGITTKGEFGIAITQYCQDEDGGDWCDGYIHIDSGKIDDVLAWMPLPEPYKEESEVDS